APVDDRIASFIGAANLIDGVLEAAPDGRRDNNGYVLTSLGRLPARWDGELPSQRCDVTVLVRPEQITITGASGPGGPPARVLSRGFHGHDTVLNVEITEDHSSHPLLVRALGSPP